MTERHRVTFAAMTFAAIAMVVAPAQSADTAAAPAQRSPSVQAYIDMAKFMSPGLPTTLVPNLTSAMPGSGLPRNTNKAVAPPTKVFDQLYFLGMGSVGSWALVTRDGIIQFDTLDNADEAERIILGGYRKLGLDPAKIKYVIVTHGHGDHYGGARYLQDKLPGLKVMMSAVDYDLADRTAKAGTGPFGKVPAPRHDLVVTDGQKVTLGDTTVTLYITPGHTPGTVSAIFPVTDNGTPHMVAFWGGTGYPATFEATPASGGLNAYEASLNRFTSLAQAAGVDTPISNHAEIDGSYDKAVAMQNRKPGDPNPFVLGQSTYVRFMSVIYAFMDASKELAREKLAKATN